MSLLKRRFILYEDGDEDTDTNNDPTEVDTSSDNTDSGEENSDESPEDQDNNTEDEDYDIDTEPDPEEDTEEGDTIDSDNSEEDTSPDDSGDDDSSSSEEKELDRELFDSLSDSEKERKISTLKELYKDLYGKCSILIEKFNQLTENNNDDFKPAIKRILTILYDLKEFISYYLLNVYDKTSYIENDVNFNRYLSILNGIKLTVKELEKVKKDENK